SSATSPSRSRRSASSASSRPAPRPASPRPSVTRREGRRLVLALLPLHVGVPAPMTDVADHPDFPLFLDHTRPMIISAFGKKGKGKSAFNREIYRSYPGDKLTIDVRSEEH